jgi:hypothetical protein
MAVVEALAHVTETDPMELEPLYDSVEIDALGRLFRGGEADPGAAHESIAVSWVHGEHAITVEATGVVTVAAADTGGVTMADTGGAKRGDG